MQEGPELEQEGEQQLGKALGTSLEAAVVVREGVRAAAAANGGGNGCSFGRASRDGSTSDTAGETGQGLPEPGNGQAEVVVGAAAGGVAAAAAATAADVELGAAQGPGAEEELLLLDLPVTGCMDGWEVAPTSAELKALLHKAVGVASLLASRKPHVANLSKLARRIQKDLQFMLRCVEVRPEGQVQAGPGAGACPDIGVGVDAPAAPAAAPCGAGEAAGPATVLAVEQGNASATAIAAAGEAAAAAAVAAAEAVMQGGAPEGPGEGGADDETASLAGTFDGDGDGDGGADGDGDGKAAGRARVKGKGWGGPVLLTPGRIQGMVNNLRGFQGELLAAQLAPDVVGVMQRFSARVKLAPEGGEASRGKNQRQQQLAQAEPAQLPGRGGTGTAVATASATAAAALSSAVAAPAAAGVKRPRDTEDMLVPDTYMPPAAGAAAPLPGATAAPTASTTATNDPDGSTQSQLQQYPSDQARGNGSSGAQDKGKEGQGKGKGKSNAKGGGGGGGDGLVSCAVEVDVVAQGGHCWVEVKNQEVFGTESVHWTGAPRHVKGLRRQVEELLAVAAAPQHQRRWRAPAVVLFFPSGVAGDVRRAVEAMGAHVAEGPESLRSLPPPPPAPASTNLDVTTMCALVSELSHGGAQDPDVELWAARTVHWVDCLTAERSAPILAQLDPWVAPPRPLLAARLAVRQFETLLALHGGPRERGRWEQLLARLQVVDTEDQPEAMSERARQLLPSRLGKDQVAVFGLGDGTRAMTLTANGNAVRSAERGGMNLETLVHRPVWLAGR